MKNRIILILMAIGLLTLVMGCAPRERDRTQNDANLIGTVGSIGYPRKKYARQVQIAVIDTLPTRLSSTKLSHMYGANRPSQNSTPTHADYMIDIISKYAPINSQIDLFVAGEEKLTLTGIKSSLHEISTKKYDIVNMSFYFSSSTLEMQSNISTAQLTGTVFVASAGNHSRSFSDFPARLRGVFSIGAITPSGEIADYSNFGNLDYVMPGRLVSRISKKTLEGTSVSAALATAALAHMLARDRLNSVEEVRKQSNKSVIVVNQGNYTYRQLTLRRDCQ